MRRLYLIIIIVASLVTHFLFFGHPKETVFDEVHFGKFISGYFTREYFFDIHPPLAKLVISAAGYLADFKPGFNFAEIGQKFPDNSFFWLRLLPMLAGIALPIIVFRLALELRFSYSAAFTAGFLTVLENSLLAQSRLILLDSFLLIFGFLALALYFHHRRTRKAGNFIAAIILATLALLVKWTGATFLAIILVLETARIWRETKSWGWGKILQNYLAMVLTIVGLVTVIYFAVFAVHLSILNKSGPGDAFMTPEFRKTLAGTAEATNPQIKSSNIFQKFTELNIQMYKSNANLTASHPYSSKWYSWPFMVRPIYYWYGAGNQLPATGLRIYFMGNPVIWWLSTAAVIFLLVSVLPEWKKMVVNYDSKIKVFLLGAYFINLFPFIFVSRALFLYHYLTALIFAILILVWLIEKTLNSRRTVLAILLAMSIISFIYFAPLSYGLPLTASGYNARVWFPSWQ